MMNPRDLAGNTEEEEDTCDLSIGTVVVILPGALHCTVTARTGLPGVYILYLDEIVSLFC